MITIKGGMSRISVSQAIEVKFHETGESVHFGSLAAIFEVYTPAEVGCTLRTLYGKLKKEGGYATNRCFIRKYNINRLRRR